MFSPQSKRHRHLFSAFLQLSNALVVKIEVLDICEFLPKVYLIYETLLTEVGVQQIEEVVIC